MEMNVKKQDFRESAKMERIYSLKVEESSTKLHQIQSKSLINLQTEEKILINQLENLKKENFSLEASIQAWKSTYEQKKNELAQGELKLNEIYNQIWSEREEFCKRADNFNNQYGILSEWWKERMDECFSPLLKKADEIPQEKLDASKINISEPEEKVEILEKEYKPVEIFNTDSRQTENCDLKREKVENESPKETRDQNKVASPTEENEAHEDFSAAQSESRTAESFEEASKKLEFQEGPVTGDTLESTVSETFKEDEKRKKVRFLTENDRIIIFNEGPDALKMKFFSIVDTEIVKKANRFKNTRKKQLSR